MTNSQHTLNIVLPVTFTELKAFSDLLRDAYEGEAYYADRSDEDVADGVDDDGKTIDRAYQRRQRDEGRAKRALYSDLHARLTGEPIIKEAP